MKEKIFACTHIVHEGGMTIALASVLHDTPH
jgi:hypothetical protein